MFEREKVNYSTFQSRKKHLEKMQLNIIIILY